MVITISNEFISCTVDSHGAEIRSVKNVQNGKEYMWNADPSFWNRTSPVLFPVVGKYCEETSFYNKEAWHMGSQHGFARDMEFILVDQTEESVLFELTESEETLKKYPFAFVLQIGYELVEETVNVIWRVKNTDDKTIYFSIGAHPAFLCEIGKDRILIEGKDTDALKRRMLNKDGLATDEVREVSAKDGYLNLTDELFSEDALVFEDSQVSSVAIENAAGDKIITVSFDSPLVGIWSPVGKHAPFICIEPWYGRTDREGFKGEISEREWGNSLEEGKIFESVYSITVHA